jgi:hypothetical protein
MAPYLCGLNLDNSDVVVPTTEHGDVDALNNADHNLLHSLARVILQITQRKKSGFSLINHLPPDLDYSIGAVSNFSKSLKDICSARCITGINNTSGKLTPCPCR